MVNAPIEAPVCSSTDSKAPLRYHPHPRITPAAMRIAPTSKTPHPSRPFAFRCFVLLVALLYGWMAHSSLLSTAHDPASWAGHEHAAILAAQSGDHGHSHDHDHEDPATDSHDPASSHGQHTADHSHDKPNLKRSHHQAVVKPPRIWASLRLCPNYPEPCFAFERPPKHPLQA